MRQRVRGSAEGCLLSRTEKKEEWFFMAGQKEIIIDVPKGIEVSLSGSDERILKIKSGSRSFERDAGAKNVKVSFVDGKIIVKALGTKKSTLAIAGTLASVIKSIVEGAGGKEYEYELEIVYAHFPITVAVKGNKVEINNLRGAKEPRIAKILGDSKVIIKGKNISVKGSDKQLSGQTAANIESATRVTNTDRRVFQDGIYITKKAE